jgi:hypothetical protein
MVNRILCGLVLVTGMQALAAENVQILNYQTFTQRLLDEAHTTKLNWKVGDIADYKLNVASFLQGKMHMFIREVGADGIWLQQDVDIQIQKQKVEILFDGNNGQVKKILVDGQEQKASDPNDQEIVESKPATVTVPAGTFECGYLKIHSKKDNTNTDVWINPELIPMLGLIKTVAQSQMGPVTLELTSFSR